MGKLSKKPIYDWTGHIIGYECQEKYIKIIVCEKKNADKIIILNHYSKKPTKNSFLSFLVLWKNQIHGALQLGYGIRPKIKGEYSHEEIVEFDRMYLSDEMPKFSETITLSLLHKYIKKVYPSIKALISYADTSVGNMGIIYQASNYKLLSSTKVDFYILPHGERVHPVTMWHRHKTRVWSEMQKLYPGIIKAEGEQLKYIYYLDKYIKKKDKISQNMTNIYNADMKLLWKQGELF